MNTMTVVSLVASLVGILVGCTALFNFASNRRSAAMAEGKRQEAEAEMRRDLDRAHEKIRALEQCNQKNEVMLAEIRTDLKHVLDALREMREKLDGRA